MSYHSTQIIINCRDRLSPLKTLIQWLRQAQYENILLLDNASTYPPLLQFYQESGLQVIYLADNLKSRALWEWQDAAQYIQEPFVYTDPDILPTCPPDVIRIFFDVIDKYPDLNKIGLGLKIDDIPNCYSQVEKVKKWESQFWNDPFDTLGDITLYRAAVATTFALYPKFQSFSLAGARTGCPYIARHIDWYMNSECPTEEQLYYEQHSVGQPYHNWGINKCLSSAVNKFCD